MRTTAMFLHSRLALCAFVTIRFSDGGHFRFLSIASNNLTILANIIYDETSGSRMETE